jgi:arsenite/tail-anchored protein-transporting ATPase
VAAAVAVRLARARPQARMLLLSTDPAHSIGDVLNAAGASIGDEAKTIAGAPANLFVREVDAARALGSRRRDFQQALEEIASTLAIGESSAAERSARLLDLAPPGIDELFGMVSVVDAREQFDVIIVDTAPTGHALRLLELPDAAREWVQVLLRMLLKYRSLVRPGQLASELVDASRSIRALQALLRDPAAARFLVVTRASEVPRLETERLLDRLRRLRLSVAAVVVNARTLAPRGCPRCRKVAAAERQPLAAIRALCKGRRRACAIIETPLAAPAPRGVKALERWAATWVAKES